MDEIIQLFLTDPIQAIQKLFEQQKDEKEITNIKKEYTELERTFRPAQVGNIQIDKTVGEGEKKKIVTKVKIPIPFQQKIVQTATAFEVGEPPTLIPEDKTPLSDEVERLWKVNRMNSKIQKSIKLQKSELQCAVLFYIEELKPENFFNRMLGVNKKKEIKTTILENAKGSMAPYFDAYGDMKAFSWKFKVKEDDQEVENVWVYTEEDLFILMPNEKGEMALDSTKKHGFTKIPIVYMAQDKAEWFLAEAMIDRLEVALSRLGDANDYTGHPIMKIWGEVDGAPDKDEEGKAFQITMDENDEGKIEKKGDVEFLTYDQAPKSVQMELDQLEKYIYTLTSTPDISFDNVKGLGNIAGVALRLMFLDAIIKAKVNEGENRTMIERMISIYISGTVKTTVPNMKSDVEKTFFGIQFNSIIPDDVSSAVETLVKAVEAKIMSQKTAVGKLDATDDSTAELEEINRIPDPPPGTAGE